MEKRPISRITDEEDDWCIQHFVKNDELYLSLPSRPSPSFFPFPFSPSFLMSPLFLPLLSRWSGEMPIGRCPEVGLIPLGKFLNFSTAGTGMRLGAFVLHFGDSFASLEFPLS